MHYSCPFGMPITDRHDDSESYRYGFNGMEKDDEFSGDHNSYTTYYRQLDPRLGRWLSIDPARYLGSPYTSMANNPILMNDMLGDTTWNVNSSTGDRVAINGFGGNDSQIIYFDGEIQDDGSITGGTFGGILETTSDALYVGPVQGLDSHQSTHDVLYAVSDVDLWAEVPDEYLGYYSPWALLQRFKYSNDPLQNEIIKKEELLGIEYPYMSWGSAQMYQRYLFNKYGSTSGIVLAYDTDLLGDMLDPSGGTADVLAMLKKNGQAGVQLRRAKINSVRNVRSQLSRDLNRKLSNHDIRKYQLSNRSFHDGTPLSNNSWIRYGQITKGQFTRANYGSSYMQTKQKLYRQWLKAQ